MKLIPIFITFLFISFLVFGLPVYATNQNCPSGYEDNDSNSPYTHTTSASKEVWKVCVRASDDDIFEYTSNGSDGCYSRSGILSQTSSVVRVGSGSCKSIDSVKFYTRNKPTPSPSPTPTPSPSPQPTPSPSPSATPSAMPTPNSTPCGSACDPVVPAKSVPTATVCRDAVPGEVANIYVDRGTPNDGKLEVRWLNASPNEGAQHAHIVYTDTTPGDWKYALLNTPNDGSEVIGELKNNQHYWYSVALVNGCSVGNFSTAFDPIP